MDSNPELLIIGNLAFDKIQSLDKFVQVVGGAAFYNAIGASFFNKKIGVVSRVGEDFPLNVLEERGIFIGGIRVFKNKLSDVFYSITVSSNELNNSIKDEICVGKDICSKDIPSSFLNAKYIHIATMNPALQLEIISALRMVAKGKISIDTCRDYILQNEKELNLAIQLADLVFLNEIEYGMLKITDKDIIIKRGKMGAKAIINGVEYYASAPLVEVIDTNGCGDVLAGAFLGLLSHGVKIETALQESVNLASQKALDFGAMHLLKEEEKRYE